MNELISVIIPVYNVEAYLAKCIESVVNQTYSNLEIILINDGSTDNSFDVCNKYAAKDDRIKLISQENGGLSKARNVGLDICSGKYITFIDSDDYISYDMIEKLYKRLINDNTDISVCSYKYVNEYDEEINQELSSMCEMKNEILDKTEMFYKISHLTKGYWYYIPAWGKLYKADIFENYRFPEGRIHEDEFAIHHIIWKVNNVSVITDKLYMYFQRCNSITKSPYTLSRLDAFYAFLDRYSFYTNHYRKKFKELRKDALKAAYDVITDMFRYIPNNYYRKSDLKRAVIQLSIKQLINGDLRGVKLVIKYFLIKS